MASTLSYPGVYIEEISSGVRPITGVATSITAFIGRALRGPTNEAVTINNFGDFERVFGGLWVESQLSFAVNDFFQNGGSQAIVVRLYRAAAAPDGGGQAPSAHVEIDVGALTLEAASEGTWGSTLRVEVDKGGSDTTREAAAASLGPGLTKDDLFNLTVREVTPGGSSEKFLNLTVKESARRIDRVLKTESRLLRWRKADDDTDLPLPTSVSAEKDPLSKLEQALKDARDALSAAQISGGDHSAQKTAVENARNALSDAEDEASGKVSDGQQLNAQTFLPANGQVNKEGLYALEQVDLFNLLCIPPYTGAAGVDDIVISAATAYCERRRAFHLIDPPPSWKSKTVARDAFRDPSNGFPSVRSKNAAIFFPRILQPNLLRENRLEAFAPSGAIAGVFARTDTQRGVWKAPAGLDATLRAPALEVNLTDEENGELNVLGLNCLRAFPVGGRVVWGARTLRGADQLADEWKYIPIRRTALFIEESLYRGTQWVVFEPNDEPLWAQIRLNVGAFMNRLFRQGAFQGQVAEDAYFVRCDEETTTQNDIDLGIVNILVGFAPLKPAEFVVIKLQQIAGEIQI